MPSSMALISGPAKVSGHGQPQSAGDIVATYPLTRSQEGIWVDYLANRTSTQYNLTLEWNMVDNAETKFKTGELVAGRLTLPMGITVDSAQLN